MFTFKATEFLDLVNEYGTREEKEKVAKLIAETKEAYQTIEDNRRSRAQGGLVTICLPFILDLIMTTASPWLKTVCLLAGCYAPGKISSILFPIKHSNFSINFNQDIRENRPPQEVINIVIQALEKGHKQALEEKANSTKAKYAQLAGAGVSHWLVGTIPFFKKAPLSRYGIPIAANSAASNYYLKIQQ